MIHANTTNIPSNANLSDIIAYLQDSKSVELIKAAVKNVGFIEKIDISKLKKNMTNMNILSDCMGIYLGITKDLLNVLKAPSGSDLASVLGFVEEVSRDSDGGIVKKQRYTQIEAFAQITKVYDVMFDVMGKIMDKQRLGLIKAIGLKRNIKQHARVMATIIDAFVEAFRDINTKDLAKSMDLLVSSPETIITSDKSKISNTTNADGKSNQDTQNNIKTIKRGGKMGLLDIIQTIFGIFESLNNMKPPRLTLFLKTVWSFTMYGRLISAAVAGFCTVLKDNLSTIKTGSEAINGEDGLMTLFRTMNSLMDALKSFTKQVIIYYKLSKRAIGWFGNMLTEIFNLFVSESFKKLASFNLDILRNVEKIVDSLVDMIESLKKIKGVPLGIKRTVRLVFGTITTICEQVGKFTVDSKKLDDAQSDISRVIMILKDITGVIKSVLILGLLAIPVMVACGFAMAAVTAIILLLRWVNWMLKFWTARQTNAIRINIFNLIRIMYYLVLIQLAVIAVGLLTPIMWKNILVATGGFILLAAFLLVLAGIFWALEQMRVFNTIAIYGFKISLTLLMLTGVVLFMAFSLWLMSFMAEQVLDNVWPILGLFGISMVIIVLTLAVGLAAGFVVPYALPGLILMTVAVLALLLIAGCLWLLTKIDLDQDKVMENVEKVLNTVHQILDRLFNTSNDVKTPGTKYSADNDQQKAMKYVARNSWVGTVIKIFFAAITLVLAFVAVAMILGIAAMLRLIQELNLEDDTIQEKVRIVIKTCHHVIQQILNPKGEDEGEPSDKHWLREVVDFLGLGGIATIVDAILAFAYVALMAASILMILLLAGMLLLIDQVEFTDPASKVNTIMETCKAVVDAVCKSPEKDPSQKATEKDEPWYVKLGNTIKSALSGPVQGLVNVIKALASIAYIAIMLGCILIILALAWALSKLSEAVVPADASTITTNILNACQEIVKSVIGFKADFDADEIPWELVDDFASVSKKAAAIAINIKQIANQKVWAQDAIHVKNTFDAMKYSINAIGGSDDKTVDKAVNVVEKLIEFHNSMIFDKKAVENFKSITDDSVKLLDKIGSADINNLQTAVNLFKQLAEFSKSIDGNFEALADALNEKIAPLLERLQEQIDNLNSTVQITAADTQEAMYDSSISSMEVQSGNNGPLTGFLTDLFKSDDSGYDKASEYRKRMNDLASKYRTSNNWDTLYAILTEEGVRTT